jgi:hypothetical protein
LCEAAGLAVSEEMRVGIGKQQQHWLTRYQKRQTTEYNTDTATNKTKRREQRAEAAKVTAKKNHHYNKNHMFEFFL